MTCESPVDPGESWWEQLVHHEYNECSLYHPFMEQEGDPAVTAIWEPHRDTEPDHSHIAADLMRRHDGREAAEVCAPSPPNALTFEPDTS
ncbi:hypothetical protein [Streptomyces sp. NPDC017524]|uniref:hypothetical protein n=1 Tax=Streptomyces sp. NPDC017524 TaxID=3364999 RepID=UPI00378E3D14